MNLARAKGFKKVNNMSFSRCSSRIYLMIVENKNSIMKSPAILLVG